MAVGFKRWHLVKIHNVRNYIHFFIAVTGPVQPSLLSVTGVSGLGLFILDSRGEKVLPGIAGTSSILMPENDELVYTVTPVRTGNIMTAGKFRAVANFQVNYE